MRPSQGCIGQDRRWVGLCLAQEDQSLSTGSPGGSESLHFDSGLNVQSTPHNPPRYMAWLGGKVSCMHNGITDLKGETELMQALPTFGTTVSCNWVLLLLGASIPDCTDWVALFCGGWIGSLA